jgi:3-phosphoshikimate 1-carboxyvinyltransferase
MSWQVRPVPLLGGSLEVPGDKSITHRAYLLGAMAEGETVVRRPLLAGDTGRTLAAVEALGAGVARGEEVVRIRGAGYRALDEPSDVLDLGNSGTSARLLLGLLAGRPFHAVLTGDDSLRRRPMLRVVEPLRRMGAGIEGRAGGSLLPLAVRGGDLAGIEHRSPVASAQVKSCLLIAGLQARGHTTVSEPSLSRDHTERLLAGMGVELERRGCAVTLRGGQSLAPADITVPGDLSSAAFFMVAAAILPGSEVTVRGVGVNPTRTGILDLLSAMGASVSISPRPDAGGEPVADVTVRGGELRGVEVPPEWIPRLIDELPIAAVAAAFASGPTAVRGAGELRAKESDRIAGIAAMLEAAGAEVEGISDGFTVAGLSARVGGKVLPARHRSGGDHRLAMAAAVLALRGSGPSQIAGTSCVATSFPGFPSLFSRLAPGALSVEDDL